MTNHTPTDIEVQAAAHALRQLVKALSDSKFSYQKIIYAVGEKSGWTLSALKQFARGHTPKRLSQKHSILANVVQYEILMQRGFLAKQPENAEHLRVIQENLINGDHTARLQAEQLTREIGNTFQRLRKSGRNTTWPQPLALVRYDWTHENLIIMLVKIRSSAAGISFTMQIEGRHENRRVIVGDILTAAGNTSFSGLAYNVMSQMDSDEFFRLDMFDKDVRTKVINPMEIGLECFTLSQAEVTAPFAPVTFQGLDSRGHSVSGVGMIVSPDRFNAFNINPDGRTAVIHANQNSALTELMEKFGAQTIAPASPGNMRSRSASR